jgi:8-oxo-dGTP pyrophosphatase MutT (NUDIX family)
MIWQPHVTVAAVIEQDGKFLLVEEETDDGIRFNQPAGHWEENETLLQGVVREALEETAYHFEPEWLQGVYRWHHPHKDITYLRFAFAGSVQRHEPQRRLDSGILHAVWMSPEEIHATADRHRSPLVLQCVEDFLAGKKYPLDVVQHF